MFEGFTVVTCMMWLFFETFEHFKRNVILEAAVNMHSVVDTSAMS